ncbi:MAG: hypothetical protein A2Y94_09065 [Caldithrix sp. RBG_13_44_9]|nr:MAG: hypothetical protein A2Y94_09065 [Caldithrix sp. RBG_13_44_9]
MRKRKQIHQFAFLCIFLLILPFGKVSGFQTSAVQEIGIIEHLGELAPLDLSFLDENGDTVLLKDLSTKPLVVSLVYFNCPGICSPLLGGVVDVLDRLDLQPGKDYRVVTISFNPNDTPALAREKKKNYFKAFRRGPFPEEEWKWLTGDSLTIQKFTDAVGFKFKKEGKDFAHAGTLIVLGADGKISRYLRGIEFQPFDLKMAITEAGQGRVGPTISKVLLYCFSYDPAGKKYVFNFTKVGGSLFLAGLLIFIAFLTIKKQNRKGESEVKNG